ncbi:MULTISPECIES: VWA domain-containing protein [unclassified Rhizobium]|uniref:vWA domain-containing protein n=1 Tax=unclassified Rhizobium TaxID=2613769 RepID=UPI000ABEA1B0|nr:MULTISPECIES: VWA domain-containing protein [unclassified Rhizobium]
MLKQSKIRRHAAELLRDRKGNFGIMGAIALPVVLVAAGVAIDATNLVMARNHLQDASDSAALAASSALVNQNMSIADAKLLAVNYLKAQMYNWNAGSGLTDEEVKKLAEEFTSNTVVDIKEVPGLGNNKNYYVDVSTKLAVKLNPMTQITGNKTANVTTRSKAEASTEAKNALSMYLVLDQSGSMGDNTATADPAAPTKQESYTCGKKTCYRTVTNYLTKIAALKRATADLLTQLKNADVTTSLVRTGAVSYSSKMFTPTSLDWGEQHVLNYVNALPASGSTDSSAAFAKAYADISAATEKTAHKNKNGQVPTKYIVFMTDGENNYYNGKSNSDSGKLSDAATKKSCDDARTAGIQVYTVAFMAPDAGKKLLSYCATDASHYFSAEDATQLTAAFKYIGEKASQLSVRLTQ